MTTGKFVSLKVVADRLMQNPILKELTWEFIVSNAVECMRIVGVPQMFVADREIVEIANNKGKLPTNIINIKQVFKKDGQQLLPMNTGQDTMHDHYSAFETASRNNEEFHTYSINNTNIFVNFLEGEVLIVYDTILTDEDCYPMIPDSAELRRAIESYIKYRWYDILNDMDKMSDRKLQKAEQDYSFNVAQAVTHMQMPSIDEMEALVNSITRLIPTRVDHQSRFMFLGNQEYLKVHP